MPAAVNEMKILSPAACGTGAPGFSPEVLERAARAYLSVFSNPTWNVWRFDPTRDAAVDGRTGAVVRTVAQQAKNILTETCVSGRRSVVRLLEAPQGIAGFAWGWETTMDDLNREKLKLSDAAFGRLTDRAAAVGIDPSAPIFYLSQVGLDERYRGAGLGKALVAATLEGAACLGLADRVVLRTSCRRDLPFRYFLREGAEVLAEGFDDIGNVVMTGPRNVPQNARR